MLSQRCAVGSMAELDTALPIGADALTSSLPPEFAAAMPAALAVVGEARAKGEVVHMHKLLDGLARSQNITFKLSGVDLTSAEVFAHNGLLPMIACIAQDAGQRLLGADFGCELRRMSASEPSMLGARCVVPPMTGHIADVVRSLFFVHYATEVLGLRENAMVEVQPVLETLWPVFSAHIESFGEQETEGGVPWPQLSHEV